MIIHEYQCKKCKAIQEVYVDSENIPAGVKCNCGYIAKRIVSMAGTTPVDSPWLSEVLEVVDKKSKAPHCTEFLKHPSRANYQVWKRTEGLRHLDPGEPTFPKIDKKNRKAKMKKEMIKKFREREAIAI